MEVFLLIVIVLGFIANFLAMRHFFRQIFRKINFTENVTENPITGMGASGASGSIPVSNPLFQKAPDEPAPTPNNVPENDPNEMEFNEQTFNSLPADLKIEIEGGDTNTPPGFEEKNQ